MGEEASLDPRPGGEYRVEVISGQRSPSASSWRSTLRAGWSGPGGGTDEQPEPGGPPGSTTIEVELMPDGDGTLAALHAQRAAETRTPPRKHAHGWDHYLARLEIAARGDDPGRDTWLDGVT